MIKHVTLPPLHIHDLRAGTSCLLERDYSHPLQIDVDQAIRVSSAERYFLPIRGTTLGLFADLSLVEDGNGSFQICSAEPLDGDRIAAGTPLFHAAVATHAATAPLAWRYLLQRYYGSFARPSVFRTFSAPGLMPRSFPWRAGFQTLDFTHLPKLTQNLVWTVAKLASLCLLRQCDEGWRKVAAGGNAPVEDDTLYPELSDWRD